MAAGASAFDIQQYKKAMYEGQRTNHTEVVSNATFNAKAKGMPFDCKVLGPSPTVPTSVHALRPGDIRVIGAIGDSITAGFGESSQSLLDLITEWRGRSWSVGAEFTVDRQATVANILQEFNPSQKLVGPAVGNGGPNSANARFNIAVSGAIARDMPGQARNLVTKIKNDNAVDFNNDWKVVTLWIGGNDLCAVCTNRNNAIYQPASYAAYLEEALDEFMTMPRTFVNLVSMLEITQLSEVQSGLCVAGLICRCGTTDDADDKLYTQKIASEYIRLTAELGTKAKYQGKDDFYVAVQPFFTETKVPRTPSGEADTAFFAPDCFHFSELGHEGAAVALWNNMLEAEGSKRTAWVIGEALKCPSEARPFLATSKNGN